MVTVRNATPADADRLAEIYNHYVRHTAVTFEYDPLTADDFRRRMVTIMRRYPYLVVLRDGRIEGYAYAGAFVGRAAYDWACEMTVYIAADARRAGLGKVLYEALEKALSTMGICNLYACIGYPPSGQDDEYLTTDSARFHARLGYTTVGTFHLCGYKFGRWYDMIWMEKIIGDHTAPMPQVMPYPHVKPSALT